MRMSSDFGSLMTMFLKEILEIIFPSIEPISMFCLKRFFKSVEMNRLSVSWGMLELRSTTDATEPTTSVPPRNNPIPFNTFRREELM